MNPEDFLDTAGILLLNPGESNLRSCVSRAYYAVYQLLRIALLQNLPLILLQQSGLGAKNYIAHDKLPSTLKQSSDPTVSTFGQHLEHLKFARTKADYHLDKPLSKPSAIEQYENADELRNDLKKYGIQNVAMVVKKDLEKIHCKVP